MRRDLIAWRRTERATLCCTCGNTIEAPATVRSYRDTGQDECISCVQDRMRRGTSTRQARARKA